MRPPKRTLLRTRLSPFEALQVLRRRRRNAFLLESRPGPRRLTRFSILGSDPAEFFADRKGGDPFPTIREVVAQHRVPARTSGFACGLVGAIGYDAITHLDLPAHRARAPTYLLGLYLDAIVYDHLRRRVEYVSVDEDRSEEFAEALAAPARAEREDLEVGAVTSNTTRYQFDAMIAATKRRIRDGETYQTVLSRRFDASFKGDLAGLYRRLQERNPSPYMYFLDFAPAQIVGSSPEMLLRVEGRRAETFPIAGTRPVGSAPAADRKMKTELLADPKENAEHIMLVDLARNDLGRVCRFGSVKTPSFRKLESYANVHHLVSRVTGDLRPDADAIEAFRSVFPAGTVSGAPKIRAMEIIDELEKDPRGLYAGAIGYFGLNGNLDSAITIRTLTTNRDGRLSVQAGAGIVQDSRPEAEWKETQHKANAILPFLEVPA